MSNISKYQFTITYVSDIDTDTGEVLKTEILSKTDMTEVKKSAAKAPKASAPAGSEPILTLDSNKIQLNNKAIELLGAEVGDKIDIRYSVVGSSTVPTIGKEDVFGTKCGTKLTKSGTCSYRGAKNDELASRGNVFNLIAHPKTKGLFILSTGDEPTEEKPVDDVVSVDTDEIDFTEVFEDNDILVNGDVTVIDSNFFNLSN